MHENGFKIKMNDELTQNTPEWFEFRRTKIGASDAPIIMEVSPWKTPFQLWLEKTRMTLQETAPHQMRGIELEKLARHVFEKKTGMIMNPKVVLHPTLDWMMASLDGIDGNAVLEIKCPGQNDHEIAKNGKIPEKYIPQIQHQLAVTSLNLAYYFSFDGSDGIVVEVGRDDRYIERMICKELAFWKCIETCTPPPLNDRDFVRRNDFSWIETSQKWLKLQKKLTELEHEEKSLRETLIQMAENQSCFGGGIRLTRSLRKGNIQYSQIQELKEIDLEKYRNAPSEYWRLSAIEQQKPDK